VTLSAYPTAHLRRTLGLLRSLAIYWRPGRQRPLRRLYRPFIQPGDRVFDVGAHLGDRTAAFAALGARVVAVEPQPQLLRWLRRLVGRRGDVVIVPQALGERCGTAQLALSHATPTVSSLAAGWREHLQRTTSGFRDVRWEQTLTVPVTTLDVLVQTYGMPAFCKIDVEGFEAQVLAGLSYPIPALSFEFINGALEQATLCLAELGRLGKYEFNAIAGEERSFLWSQWQTTARVRQWLDSGADGISSGDIYARLVRPHD
jgi:FkbM family methyltransferase